ncbi:NAD(P)-binding Rossmann-fold superfamily protein [Rhynchospora pubera]|uniref:NAD(P)-binding Rossmann-fold superfamily protein n=1 Tax=Rhynchospora pubera TaxID=906938 RepID=A0AAV8BZ86_9POAL|nr:NAD(P)-binding Rossmann-fold superfamily protein [Rhynchospora pubera]KAJ4799396.1 NAD(P)-binding Rossmann-fold superfamily protein [Rhynchospora pubera]KAJ4810962.1 NAD(P)-binding Rossmann-fold superfamily protein [Rhynchospora pubera]
MASASMLASAARRLEGKVALITGGASGIGKATAKLFAQQGGRLVIADIQDKAGSAVCEELNTQTKATYVHCDVTNESDVEKAVDAAIDRYGKLDIMFNNAGVIGSPVNPILQSDKSNFQKVMSVNVTGCYLGTKHAARVMIPARRGSIISTASVASVEPGITPVAYTCSKHAVLGIMRSAAAELGPYSIRVNCVSPNVLPTPLAAEALQMEETELQQAMEDKAVLKGVGLNKDDVAYAALYLGSDESKYVSGLNLLIDGAFSVTNPSFGVF